MDRERRGQGERERELKRSLKYFRTVHNEMRTEWMMQQGARRKEIRRKELVHEHANVIIWF